MRLLGSSPNQHPATLDHVTNRPEWETQLLPGRWVPSHGLDVVVLDEEGGLTFPLEAEAAG
jgi:hypothetical protein